MAFVQWTMGSSLSRVQYENDVAKVKRQRLNDVP